MCKPPWRFAFKHIDHAHSIAVAAHAVEGFQNRQVGLRRAVEFDALAARDTRLGRAVRKCRHRQACGSYWRVTGAVICPSGSDTGSRLKYREERIDECGFADARFTGNEDHLCLARTSGLITRV